MRKTDKKLEKQIREALTEVCDRMLDQSTGFQWITHLVNFDRFPESLKIVCIFDLDRSVEAYKASTHYSTLLDMIALALKQHNIQINSIHKHIFLDSEEACERSHAGKWADRLQRH